MQNAKCKMQNEIMQNAKMNVERKKLRLGVSLNFFYSRRA